MSSQTPRTRTRLAVALALAVGLAGALPGAASGRPERAGAVRFQEIGGFQQAWGWLTALASAHNPVTSWLRIWGAAGPLIDPDGAPAKPSGTGASPCGQTACGDMGPLIDPDGPH